MYIDYFSVKLEKTQKKETQEKLKKNKQTPLE